MNVRSVSEQLIMVKLIIGKYLVTIISPTTSLQSLNRQNFGLLRYVELIAFGYQLKNEEISLIFHLSSGVYTTVDYMLIRGLQKHFLREAKAFPDCDVVSYHCLGVSDELMIGCKKKKKKAVHKTKEKCGG